MPSSLILCNNNKLFLDQIVMCSEKWVRQLAITSSLVGLRRSSKALPKAKLAPKKGHGHCLVVCWSTTAFWTPTNPIYLRSILNKSMICTENCNACRWHWSTEWAQFFSRTTPDHTSHNQHFRVDKLGYEVLPHPPYLPDLLPTDYYFFKHLNNFLLGKRFHSQQEAKNASCEAWFFYATGINLFLVGKNVLILML